MPSDIIGQFIGEFRVTHRIADDPRSLLYEMERGTEQAYLRLLPPALAQDRGAVARFLESAELLRRVRVPGLAAILEAGTRSDGCAYVVIQAAPGEPLSERISRREPLTSLIPGLRPLALALAALHKARACYLGLRPQRIQVVTTGTQRMQLLDTEDARVIGEPLPGAGASEEKVEDHSHPVHFMAPEFFVGAANVNPAIDAYALGALAYLLIAGRPPFEGGHRSTIIAAHINQEPAPLPAGEVPEELAQLVLTMLDKDPRKRPGVARLAEELERLYPVTSAPPPAAPVNPPRPPSPMPQVPSEMVIVQPEVAGGGISPPVSIAVPAEQRIAAPPPVINIVLPEEIVQTIRGSPDVKPEKASTWLVVAGYVFSFLGGLIGLMVGLSLMLAKASGGAGRRYDTTSRRHGRNMIILSFVAMGCWTLIRTCDGGNGGTSQSGSESRPTATAEQREAAPSPPRQDDPNAAPIPISPPQTPSEWSEFSSAEQGFAVALPGTPTVKRETQPLDSGDVDLITYELDRESGSMNVLVAVYQSGLMQQAPPSQLLDGARDGALANINGKLIKERMVFLSAPPGSEKPLFPGRQFFAETPQGLVFRARVFLVEDRLYTLVYVSQKDQDSLDDFQKFVDSFKLTKVIRTGPGSQ